MEMGVNVNLIVNRAESVLVEIKGTRKGNQKISTLFESEYQGCISARLYLKTFPYLNIYRKVGQ